MMPTSTIIISDRKILTEYNKFEFSDDTIEELKNFLFNRNKYLISMSTENLIHMKQAFEKIYISTKLAFHMEVITERNFFCLTEMLREGV